MYDWFRVVFTILNVSRIHFLFICNEIDRNFDLRSFHFSMSFRIRVVIVSITLFDFLAFMLTINRCINFSKCKSMSTILISIFNVFVTIVLYVFVITLRIFSCMNFILFVTFFQSSFNFADVYHAIALWLSVDLIIAEYMCLFVASERLYVEIICICIVLYRIICLIFNNFKCDFHCNLKFNCIFNIRMFDFDFFVLFLMLYLFSCCIFSTFWWNISIHVCFSQIAIRVFWFILHTFRMFCLSSHNSLSLIHCMLICWHHLRISLRSCEI